MSKWTKRPIEQYLFIVAVLIGLYSVFGVSAQGAADWNGVLTNKVENANGGANVADTLAFIEEAEATFKESESAGRSRREAYGAVTAVLQEPARVATQSKDDDSRRANALEPLIIAFPHYFGTPDYLPLAGVAPSIELQKRAIRAQVEPISLAPQSGPSYFGRNRIGGEK